MFKATSKHLVEIFGEKSLHPVPDLNTSEHFQTLCLLKKHDSFWFWKKPKMIPTQLKLQDLFPMNFDFPEPTLTTLSEDFTYTPTFSANGDLAAKIATEFHFNISASDTITMTINLGKLTKKELEWQSVYESMLKHQMNLDHVLIKEASKCKRTSLCVVLESVSSQGQISEDDSAEVKLDGEGGVNKPHITVDIESKDSKIEKKTSQKATLPANTVFAFSCNKFSIDEKGFATLHSSLDTYDSTKDSLYKKAPNLQHLQAVEKELHFLVEDEKFNDIRTQLISIIGSVTDELLFSIDLLLRAAVVKLEKTEEKTIKVDEKSTVEAFGVFKNVLENLGVTMTDKDGKESTFNDANVKVIQSFLCLLDNIKDIDVSVRKLLPKISMESLKIVYGIISNEVNGRENLMNSPEIQKIKSKDPMALDLLKDAGFTEIQIDDVDMFCLTESTLNIMDLYAVIYFFTQATEATLK